MDPVDATQQSLKRRRGGLLGRWLDPWREHASRPAPVDPHQPASEQPTPASGPDDVATNQLESTPSAPAPQPEPMHEPELEPAAEPEPEPQWTVPGVQAPAAESGALNVNQSESWMPREVAIHDAGDEGFTRADADAWATPSSAPVSADPHLPDATSPDEWVAEPQTAENLREG